MGKVYIVTGANGFLGSNLIRKLLDYGESEIRALVLPGESAASLEGLSCDIYYGDVTRPETLVRVILCGAEAAAFVYEVLFIHAAL